jgi:N utilization substance protein A
VRWSDDVKTFVTNALAPAKLVRVTVDEAARAVTVVAEPDQLSLAIGKKGQNARLTAKITGWKVDIQRDESALGFEEKVAHAIEALASVEGIGREHAEKLVHAGFLTVEGILAAELADLQTIEGFDEAAAKGIHDAAVRVCEQEHGKDGAEAG